MLINVFPAFFDEQQAEKHSRKLHVAYQTQLTAVRDNKNDDMTLTCLRPAKPPSEEVSDNDGCGMVLMLACAAVCLSRRHVKWCPR